MAIDADDLKLILAKHKQWLFTECEEGERADLKRADLQWADLKGANLRGADLRGVGLVGADLRGAGLERADLEGADLEGANLEGANLQGANLQWVRLENANLVRANLEGVNFLGVNFLGATYDLEQFKYALNVPKFLQEKKLSDNKTADIYAQQIKNADRQIQQLEQEKNRIEQQQHEEKEELKSENSVIKEQLKNIEEKLEIELATKKQVTSKQQLLEEMKGAIQPIIAGINADKVIIERYKKQSTWLMSGGITCFVFVIIYLVLRLGVGDIGNAERSFNVLQILSPGLILALIGTGLLRHDWKVRQLILKLIEQNNQIDIAMGLLQTSLNLSNIGSVEKIDGIPDLVKETFKEARTALLFKDATHQKASQNHAPIGSKNIEEDILKKAIQSTTQQ